MRRTLRPGGPVASPVVPDATPKLQIVAPAASPEEAAAVVAALERFLRETTPVVAAEKPRMSPWQRAALLEGVGREPTHRPPGATRTPGSAPARHRTEADAGRWYGRPAGATSHRITVQRGTLLRISRPSPAMVVALIALVFAATGTGIAATGAITGADIQNGSITSADLATGAVTSSDIRNGTVTGTDLKNASISTTDLTKAHGPAVRSRPGSRQAHRLEAADVRRRPGRAPTASTERPGSRGT